MMKLREQNCALLLIDIQKAFLVDSYWGGNRNNQNAETISGEILKTWRELDLPLFHIRHTSSNPTSLFHPSSIGFEFCDPVKPKDGEEVISKEVNGAFIGTDLHEQLKTLGVKVLVVVGLTTDHCVSTTIRIAGNYGYDTYVISDATATFDRVGCNGEKYDADVIHSTALASLNEEFATVWESRQLFKAL